MNLLALSGLSVTATSLVTALIVIPFAPDIARISNSPDLGPWIYIVPLSVLLSGTAQTMASWATRIKNFQCTSIAQVIRSLVVAGTQTGAGLAGSGAPGLMGGLLIGDTAASVVIGRRAMGKEWRMFRSVLSVSEMKRLAMAYADFPLYSSTQSVLNATSQNVPLLLLAHYFGATTVGLYSIGVRLIQLPMNLVLASLRQVLFQKSSELHAKGMDTYGLFRSATLGLAAIAFLPAVFTMVCAPIVFSFVLGDEWYVAGEYASWLVLWLAIGFVNLPAVLMGQIHRKQRAFLIFDMCLLAARVAALVVGGRWLNAMGAVALYSVVGCVFNLYIIGWMWCYLRKCRTRTATTTP